MPYYLKYGDKIKGEVDEPAHRGWIELMSVQWGVGRGVTSPTGSSAGRESSTPSVTEIVVTKRQDSASNQLFNEAFQGKSVAAVIDFLRKDPSVYFRITMSGTLVSSFQISGHGDSPTESLTLNFTKVEFKYDPGTPPATSETLDWTEKN